MKFGDAEWLNAQYRRTKVDPWGLGWRPTQRYRLALMVRLLREHLRAQDQALRIIDVGCATGDFTQRLSRLNGPVGASVLGIDIAEEAVARARQRHPDVQFECASMEQAASRWRESADCVSCLEVLYYVPPEGREAAVEQLGALLRPQGLLLVSSMIAHAPYLSLGELLDLISPRFTVMHSGTIHLRQVGQLEKLMMRLGITGFSGMPGAADLDAGDPWFQLMRRADVTCSKLLRGLAASHSIVIARKREGA